ncbi:MAG: hypothetical protein R3C19_13180 [Planctomycetaceae bacterium]
MTSVHEIRLAGPWEFTRAESPDSPQRCTLPIAVDEARQAPGAVTLTRRFHRPTGLDAGSQVRIAVDFRGDTPLVAVNGVLLDMCECSVPASETQQAEFNITGALRDFNTLTIDVRGPQISNVLLRIIP